MKRLHSIALLLMIVLLPGCFKQDYSLCGVDDNLVLLFQLEDNNGKNIFADKIDNVDAIVFDNNYHYVTSQRITKKDLNKFQGATFTLIPETYYIVCWANISSNTSFPTFDSSDFFESYHVNTISDETGSSLYYAPKKEIRDLDETNPVLPEDYIIYQVNVLPQQVTQKTMHFVRAYRRVNVYVQNYNYLDDPIIQITNIPVSYDFFLQTHKTRKNYQRISTPIDTEKGLMTLASINAPIADFHESMEINVKRQSDQETTHMVNLKEYVEQNIDKIEDINEIDILFEIDLDGDVAISFPNWETRPVNPEL